MATPLIFDTNKSSLRGDHVGDLHLVADLLLANPSLHITVEGHVNYCRTPEVAQQLSQRRAETVKKKLVALGVPAEVLAAVGYGQRRTKYPKGSIMSYRNKRVEFVITDGVSSPVSKRVMFAANT